MTARSNICHAACLLLTERDMAGQAKYGVSMDRTDLKPGQWLQHSIEEYADALQYQIKLKMELKAMIISAFNMGRESGIGCDDLSRVEVEDMRYGDLEACLKELLG